MFCQEELKPDTYTWILGKMCFVLYFNKKDQKASFFSSFNLKLSLEGLQPNLDRDKELFFSTCLLASLKIPKSFARVLVAAPEHVKGDFNCVSV